MQVVVHSEPVLCTKKTKLSKREKKNNFESIFFSFEENKNLLINFQKQ